MCTTFPMDIHICLFTYKNYVSMPLSFMALHLFHRTYELKKTHHLILTECGCMNELTRWHSQLFCENMWKCNRNICRASNDPSSAQPLMPLSQCQGNCNGHEKCLLLLEDYGYDASVSKVRDGYHTHLNTDLLRDWLTTSYFTILHHNASFNLGFFKTLNQTMASICFLEAIPTIQQTQTIWLCCLPPSGNKTVTCNQYTTLFPQELTV